MIRIIRALLADFADLLFPTLCLGCTNSLGTNEKILCTKCRISLPETNQHKEPYDLNLLNKFAGKVPVRFLASYVYFSKGGIVQKLIHAIKYKGQKEVAKEVAGWYGYQLKSETTLINEIDVLIGVPLHKSRFQQRGYNQADCIAEGLSEALNIPMRTDVLIRNRFKESQTRKNRLERWENVKTVFSVQNEHEIQYKHVAIVDDVLTTGATLEACAVELLQAGCKSVSVLTLAAAHR
ncbi:ComF family protein [Spirosoma radiotolerans]|uniref:Phosphoribosyltransferase n=1 Tax=Spirosoma radiotolerans TaxID=1379870 RepID=A0A0E3VAF8_9BACT|nr:ComF family protein [Spirosoma radiotolerans]AKD58021.1 phosphoribosyltransferase [Spirosoma radiotolerans]